MAAMDQSLSGNGTRPLNLWTQSIFLRLISDSTCATTRQKTSIVRSRTGCYACCARHHKVSFSNHGLHPLTKDSAMKPDQNAFTACGRISDAKATRRDIRSVIPPHSPRDIGKIGIRQAEEVSGQHRRYQRPWAIFRPSPLGDRALNDSGPNPSPQCFDGLAAFDLAHSHDRVWEDGGRTFLKKPSYSDDHLANGVRFYNAAIKILHRGDVFLSQPEERLAAVTLLSF
ncbi:hypothetical protein BO78DRAFT_383968 [Aspergillus sclerotiicarbonarius CBS 121057]|uniref:Uncharacterized protein n=1 Tax=Aspergillus sclerotiicarbonarius (strain CBS 121057 / IBT 28362) TaxID=1448318 RepID=A0A319EKB7_ASPSB|nr:hypothetical protein BO78DRAFT_383968 [Aspergillus sclerotiicarbonarius CBS 121057]